MKPWMVGVALLALLALGAFLWTGAGSSSGDTRAQTAPRKAGPPSAPPGRVATGVSPEVTPLVPGKPEASVHHAPAAPLPAENAVDWEQIPLDRTAGESLGDLQTRRAFSAAMRQRPARSRCTEAWTAPPEIRRFDMDIELRVRSVDDALVVEDASILEANVSDASVERCVISELRGLRASAPGIRPGQAFRIKWGATKYLE